MMRVRFSSRSFPLVSLSLLRGQWRKTVGYSIEGRFDAFTTDEMGNVYALQGDELRLFDARGRSWLRNSVKTFGRIGVIDAFYSLKPMVFARSKGSWPCLDNTLSLQGSVINLPRDGFVQVVLACMSVQNSFWFFDQRELALVRVDGQLRELAHTGRLDQVLGFSVEPAGMMEYDSKLYLNDPVHGILVFDLFGTYVKTIPMKEAWRASRCATSSCTSSTQPARTSTTCSPSPLQRSTPEQAPTGSVTYGWRTAGSSCCWRNGSAVHRHRSRWYDR